MAHGLAQVVVLVRGEYLGQVDERGLGVGQQGDDAPILHEGIGREHEGVPAQDGFVRLQPIIGQAKALLEIPVVNLRLPTIAVVLQDGADTQGRIRTQEVSGMRIPPGPFGQNRYHRMGVVAQPTFHGTRGVCAGARGRTHDDGRDALMAKMGPPLTQRTVADNAVGLGGTDPVPAV